jgi:hypothetical protein
MTNTKWTHYRASDWAKPSWLDRQSLTSDPKWPNAYTAVLGMLFIWSVVFAVIAFMVWWR